MNNIGTEIVTITVSCDHAGFEYKVEILKYLQGLGYNTIDYGASNSELQTDYPDNAKPLIESIANEESNLGVLICGTGIGMSITANRDSKVRAAVCTDANMAKLAREHNWANVLCLGSRINDLPTIFEILKSFLAAKPSQDQRHKRRVSKMSAQE